MSRLPPNPISVANKGRQCRHDASADLRMSADLFKTVAERASQTSIFQRLNCFLGLW